NIYCASAGRTRRYLRTAPLAIFGMKKPALFFDFDNTLTRIDVLDAVIERFSLNEHWRQWEDAWVRGELSTLECLKNQIANSSVSRDELLSFVSSFRVEPAFKDVLAWSQANAVEVIIVSDSFSLLIDEILRTNSIHGVPTFANELDFSGRRPYPSFPHH